MVDCPYENKENHGGKLVLKVKNKFIHKKPFVKKNHPNKKPSKIVLVTREEFSSGEEEDDDEDTSAVAAIATPSTTSTSLFESPNENHAINHIEKCLMGKSSEVSPSPTLIPKSRNTIVDDRDRTKTRDEIVGFDTFLANMQGETKKHVESLMSQLGGAHDLIALKEGFERENADEIGALYRALEEEQDLRIMLEETLSSLK